MGMNAHTKGNDAMASLAVSKTAHGGSNPSSPVHMKKDAFRHPFLCA